MKSVFTACQKALTVLLTLTALLVCGSAYAQNTIKGTVVDGAGEPVIGAAVMIPDTTTGTVTDVDGSFQINVAAGSNLEVSCIGYTTQTVKAANGMKVVLAEDSTMLEETVVIGYGTARVRDLTGSVSTVSSKDLEIPVSNVAEALQGKMAGVVVTMGSQNPGADPSIRVRGNKSISGSNDPLVLVDGFPGSLSQVPADQIKSINVLKDAAATAIYGSRGASGVILITTKSASEGKTSVSYNGYVQVKDSSTEIYDVMETADYLKFTLGYAKDFDHSNNLYDNLNKFFGIGAANGDHIKQLLSTPVHNWQKDLLKTGISHSHNISVSTGTARNRTLFSVNYVYDDGTVIDSYYQRINASLKTTQKITDNLSLDLNVTYFNSKSKNNSAQGSAYQYRAVEPLGDATNLSGFGNGSSYIDKAYDPIELTYNSQPFSISHNFRAIGSINWTPLKGLTVRSELGMNGTFSRSESYTAGYGTTTNSASLSRNESNRLNWATTVQYQLPFKNDNHRADILIGNEMRMNDGSGMTINGRKYPSNFDREKTFAFLNQYIEDSSFSTSYNTPGRAVSFFARANYTLKDRYMFTATVRADGSSNFAPENRWGIFPAGAFAWRISDEPWMKASRNWLSNLKFRLSYGITGNDSIGANQWREVWSLGGNTVTTISNKRSDTENDYVQAYAPGSQMQNPTLRWEQTITRNMGLDFGLWNERLSGSIEGYWMTTDGLLMSTPVNAASGYKTQYQNLGTISNRGFEIQLSGDIVRSSDFTLRANAIFQYNHNLVDYIAPSVTSTKYGGWAGNSERCPLDGEFSIQEGKPMGILKAYKYEGWYTVDDFNYDAATGVYTLKEGIPDWGQDSYYTSLGHPSTQNAVPGVLKVADLDKDGKITTSDTYEFGEMTPRMSGSFGLSGRWKGLDFSANFTYTLDGHIINSQALVNCYGSKENRLGANRLAFVADAYSPYRWNGNGELEFVSDPAELTKMNANATMHSPTMMQGLLLDKYIESAAYLRLKTLTIGYTIPARISTKIGMQNLRAYLSANNLFTLTKYTGLNPEVSTSSSTTPCIDNGSYPIARTFTLGLNLTF